MSASADEHYPDLKVIVTDVCGVHLAFRIVEVKFLQISAASGMLLGTPDRCFTMNWSVLTA